MKTEIKTKRTKRFFTTIIAIACILVLGISLAACTDKNTGTSYAGSTVTGKITNIDGNSVTLTLGELSSSNSGDMGGNMGGTPPEMPSDQSGTAQSGNQGNPPAKPSGDTSGPQSGSQSAPPELPSGTSDSTTDGSTPPELPNGEQPSGGQPNGGQPGNMGGGNMGQTFTEGTVTLTVNLEGVGITEGNTTISASDLEVGDILTISFGSDGAVSKAQIVTLTGGGNPPDGGNGGNPPDGGNSGTVEQGDSANTVTEDSTLADVEYTSSGDNENALRIDGATVVIGNITASKTGGASSNTENGDFYGVNACILATNGANLTITGGTVSSSAKNGNGIFSYGTGTVVTVSDVTIVTTQDNSGGIQTTGGGTTNANNLTITTSGNSSAAIRSDRGGGTVNVDGGTYTTNGNNSPAVYSTATITVTGATLTANGSEALVIEGKNSITLTDCVVYGNMSENGASAKINLHNVMIYQSMSGDAAVGTSSFSMTGGSLTGNAGDMFYVTNTDAIISLNGVAVVNNDSDGIFMRVSGNDASNGWGTAGSNGASAVVTLENQTVDGDIVVDSISTIDLTMKSGTVLNGTVTIEENAAGEATSNNAMVIIEEGAVWNLTGNAVISSLTNNGTINYNGYTVTLANGTVLGE